jgi:FlaA1/EpsC-like NDP-sugar epimerase
LAVPILALPRFAKRLIALIADMAQCVFAVWLAFYLRLDEFVSFTGKSDWSQGALLAVVTSVALALPIFVVSGFYRAIFRYSGWPALLTVVRAVGTYGILYVSIFTILGVAGVPRTVGIIQPILLLILVGASRAFARVWLGDRYHGILKRALRPKVLIYGAGSTGRQLAQALINSHDMQVTGFLDDDERLHGNVLNGVRIYAVQDLSALVSSLGVAHVLLALPTISRARRNEILNILSPFKVAVRTLPSLNDLAQGKVSVSDLRELDIDDLLGRDPVQPNSLLLNLNTLGKRVVVTGAGGSIGSELCRQIVRTQPKLLLLVDMSEFALYQIHQELLDVADGVELVPLLASVCDEVRMHEIMRTWRPHTVYHAAAYKHVPMVEHNPAEGVRNNVWGTWVCADAAGRSGVRNFVLISTDKAVRPTNIMGATKRLAELVLQALSSHLSVGASEATQSTTFSMVRFGNVLGSSGSVVPLFREQIKNGGPITLTHADITRYFMTIPEAAQLVIQSGAMGTGGDVFVLDMGSPVRIVDLAHRMVELSGLTVRNEQNPTGDIELAVTGLRPGEKLFEELLIGDNPERTPHPRIMKAHEDFLPWTELKVALDELDQALRVNDVPMIRQLLQQLVNGYQTNGRVVDWVHIEQARQA